jgi:predicted TIM-barrel fold metal-dependent hydrolase
MWKLISDASAVGSLHLRFGATGGPAVPLPEGIKPGWVSTARTVNGYFSAIEPLTQLIFTGLFDRFPTLKFLHAEVNMGWVPFWVSMMEQVRAQHGYWAEYANERNVRDFLGTNVFITGLDDKEGFRLAREGDDIIPKMAMFSIDYPHEITLFPNTQKHLKELTVGLKEDVKHNILAGNAARVFNLA